jgi:hypothetical protein
LYYSINLFSSFGRLGGHVEALENILGDLYRVFQPLTLSKEEICFCPLEKDYPSWSIWTVSGVDTTYILFTL